MSLFFSSGKGWPRRAPAVPLRPAPPEMAGDTEWTLALHPMLRYSRHAELVGVLRRRNARSRKIVISLLSSWIFVIILTPILVWAISLATPTFSWLLGQLLTGLWLIPPVLFGFIILRGVHKKGKESRLLLEDLYLTGAGFREIAILEMARFSLLSKFEILILNKLAPVAMALFLSMGRLPWSNASATLPVLPPIFLWIIEILLLSVIIRRFANLSQIVEMHLRAAKLALALGGLEAAKKPKPAMRRIILGDGLSAGFLLSALPLGFFCGPGFAWAGALTVLLFLSLAFGHWLERPVLAWFHRQLRRLLREERDALAVYVQRVQEEKS
jgi:hypothetical protein